ncbi:MAG: hypothetical protein EB141_00865 [Verrucomicrobia bacterium]|nr:hypothetical protein [Verrucomicrobiota bacterium]NDB74194.1 hypothetical protein [Verrucomicrobiota bacterium]NDE96866.1 hypothetical protein [Verrucomicrobiota bacterium]
MQLRIPIPQFVRLDWTLGFAVALFVLQVASGTNLLFAELVFIFTMLMAFTVNLLGGLHTVSGFCVAVLGLKTVVVSQVGKVAYWEPAHLELSEPVTTLLVLLCGLAGITVAGVLTRPFTVKKPLLAAFQDEPTLRVAAWLTSGIGLVSMLGMITMGAEDGVIQVGGVAGILRQLSFTMKLAVVFSTAHTLVRSGGRKAFGWLNCATMGAMFMFGLLTASKQMMFEPPLLFAVTAIAFGYAFRPAHFAALVALGLLAQVVLFPFSQVARNFVRGYGIVQSVEHTSAFIDALVRTGQPIAQLHAAVEVDENTSEQGLAYFHGASGFLERFSMVKAVDILVIETLHDGISGWETISHGFRMLVPRFLNPSKPAMNTGNFLGHKAKMLGDNDEGTQVSFGFIADSFSAFKWWGAFLVPCVLLTAFVLIYRTLTGSLERNVWCVFLMCDFQHSFTEHPIASLLISLVLAPLSYYALGQLIRISETWLRKQRPFYFGNLAGTRARATAERF